MGLLDDAIREHLELKRRHGADAQDLAKLEREAFGPVKRGAQPAEGPVADAPQAAPVEPVDPVLSEPEVDAPPPAPAAIEPEPVREPVREPEPAGIEAVEDEVEWEDPRPPQATEAFDAADVADAEGRRHEPPADGDEDVLEETPEFLQETPEHDRLWFEQKPPRDFDFDG